MPLRLKPKPKAKRYSSDDPDEYRLTLIEHLEELRDRIIRSFLAITLCWVIGWYLQPWLYDHLNSVVFASIKHTIPANAEYKEMFNNVTQPFMLKFRLSFMIAVAIAFPFILLQLWGFIAPGLKPAERKPLQRIAPLSVLLFFLGVFFCWVIIPATFSWFASYLEEFPRTVLYQEPGAMVFFVLKMMLAFGIGFQLPLVVYFLGRIGLLEPETMIQYWRQATVVIFIASATLTPSNDIFSMLMMAIPLSFLFMISVWAVRITTRKQRANAIAELNDLDGVADNANGTAPKAIEARNDREDRELNDLD
ncbi:MAG: twin-arginine translocase subunit TatC [Fimbriimonadales bacterium]